MNMEKGPHGKHGDFRCVFFIWHLTLLLPCTSRWPADCKLKWAPMPSGRLCFSILANFLQIFLCSTRQKRSDYGLPEFQVHVFLNSRLHAAITCNSHFYQDICTDPWPLFLTTWRQLTLKNNTFTTRKAKYKTTVWKFMHSLSSITGLSIQPPYGSTQLPALNHDGELPPTKKPPGAGLGGLEHRGKGF